MRQFAQKGFRIEQLSTEAKLIYTAFLVLSIAGLAVSAVYYDDLVGGRVTAGAAEYYAGARAPAPGPDDTAPGEAPAEPTAPGDDGPELDLPDDDGDLDAPTAAGPPSAPDAPQRLIAPMTWRKLLEVTHFHLFTVPVFLLIIAHLFMLCRVAPRVKLAVIASGVLSVTVHMAAPWLVFSAGAAWAWTMPVTGVWMTGSMLVMIGWPMVAMWRAAPRRGAGGAGQN